MSGKHKWLGPVALFVACAAAFPAMALAEKLNSSVSIHKSDDEDTIYGVVQAPKHKCENNRRIVLFFGGEPGKRRGSTAVDETVTDGLGQYEFEMVQEKRGSQFESGPYHVVAARKRARGDVCKRAQSRTIEIEGFNGGF